jgi:hypothetical protein
MLTFVHLGHISRLMNGVNKEIFCDVNKAGQIAIDSYVINKLRYPFTVKS